MRGYARFDGLLLAGSTLRAAVQRFALAGQVIAATYTIYIRNTYGTLAAGVVCFPLTQTCHVI